MRKVYKDIQNSISNNEKLLAVLIDPDKMVIEMIAGFIDKVNKSMATHIFVGGSTVGDYIMTPFVLQIKKYTNLPIIIFPGDITQITDSADAILFLSLISGRNPEYLINKQVQSVSKLRGINLETIPTGYILVESGKETSVQLVSKTEPMSRNNAQEIVDTAKAGELLGMKLIYLEAGSGALEPIDAKIISLVKEDLEIPLIVGGGIRNKQQLHEAYQAGANLVIIGTAFERDESLFDELV